MTAIYMTALAVLFGAGYLFVVSAFGEKLARLAWRDMAAGEADLRGIAAPVFGLLAHVLGAALALVVLPAALPWLAWAMLAIVCLDWRGTRRFLAGNWRELGITLAYGLACFAIVVSFHEGAGRGDNLFWSIYNLTAITPGDSPQGLLQAQYLLHGDALSGLRDFSLFDRPFLGGMVSLAALSAIGQAPGTVFNDYPTLLAYFYIALWVWLNATFAIAVAAVARRVVPSHLRYVAVALVLAAPFVAFNAIGAWPKLLAAYITAISALLALGGRWRWAVVISGVAFLTHGSFLWSHLSMCGLLVIYVALFSRHKHRWIEAAGLGVLAVAFPAIWFAAEHQFGAQTPLRTYYLYAVPVSHGLTHEAGEIARGFYTSTSPGNLALLPFVNLVKALLPAEMLTWLLSFSTAGPGTDLRRAASALFYTQFNRPAFAFCLTAGVIALVGIRRGLARNWQLALAVAAFFLLPLIPGMGIYRRDDHFITPTMFFAVLPLLLALYHGMAGLSRRGLMVAVTLVMGEYLLLYWSRYPGVRYESEFYEYYLWLSVGLVLLAYVSMLRRLRGGSHVPASTQGSVAVASAFPSLAITPTRLAVASLAVITLAAVAAPRLVQGAIGDGGFQKYGWNIDLSRWPNLRAKRDDQSLLHTNLRTNENGVDHGEVWINSGQTLAFRRVPTSDAGNFTVLARVHPAWNAGSALAPMAFRVTASALGEQQVVEVPIAGAREQAGEWKRVTVPLAKFAGRKVDIVMEPVAQHPGVWTLWRDPAVVTAAP